MTTPPTGLDDPPVSVARPPHIEPKSGNTTARRSVHLEIEATEDDLFTL